MSGTTEEKCYKFFPASSEHSSDHGGCFVYTACSLVIRPSLGSNWKLFWQNLAKKYTSLSTSSEINHARLTTGTAGIILWSHTTVRRNNSSLVSVLSLHRTGRSNLVERILPFFFHFTLLSFHLLKLLMDLLRYCLLAMARLELIPNVSQQDFPEKRYYQGNLIPFWDLKLHFLKVTMDTVSTLPFWFCIFRQKIGLGSIKVHEEKWLASFVANGDSLWDSV